MVGPIVGQANDILVFLNYTMNFHCLAFKKTPIIIKAAADYKAFSYAN